jgi:ligand-binding sensor domain-containing protein
MVTRLLKYSAIALAFLMGVTAEAQQYSFQYYGVDQGLTDLAVRSLFQDGSGFLWLGTENGIFRYDGTRFQAYTQSEGMPASNAAMFGEAPDGTLLVGGSFGLYRQVSNRFERLDMPGAKEVMWGAGIQSDGRGRTYIATNAGLMTMTREAGADRLRLMAAPPHSGASGAYGVLIERNEGEDKVWWGCGDDLCVVSSGTTSVLGRASGLPASAWRGIKRAGNGDLWVQSKSGRLLVMKHGRVRFEAPDLPPSPFGPRGLLSVDTSGNVIAPYGDGLAIQQDGRWKLIGRASGIHGPVYSVLQDREGSVWLGLGGHGLVRWLGYRRWEHYNAEDGLDGELVYEVRAQADGTLWAGTDSGLFRGRKTGTKWKWRKDRTLGDVPIHTVRPDAEGHLWLGTESHGAARMDTRTGHLEWFDKRRGLTADSPYTMLPDHANRIWAGSLSGLFVADSKILRFHAVPEVPAVLCLAVVEAPDGTIWAGTKAGLFQLSGDHWREFTTKDGLSHNEVLSLAAGEDGDIWVGYQFGGEIDRIQPHEGGFRISRERRDPISAQGMTYFLGFDAGKRLWAGTNRGVDVRDGGSWQHYDQHDGLVWDDCDLNGFAAMPDGEVWIGTSGGLAHFLPGEETPGEEDPPAGSAPRYFHQIHFGRKRRVGKLLGRPRGQLAGCAILRTVFCARGQAPVQISTRAPVQRLAGDTAARSSISRIGSQFVPLAGRGARRGGAMERGTGLLYLRGAAAMVADLVGYVAAGRRCAGASRDCHPLARGGGEPAGKRSGSRRRRTHNRAENRQSKSSRNHSEIAGRQ